MRSPALTAELQAHVASGNIKHPTSNVQSLRLSLQFRVAECELRIWDGAMIRVILSVIEIALLRAVILAMRCADYHDVFGGGNSFVGGGGCCAVVSEGPFWVR